VLVLSFEHATNGNWRCLYTIRQTVNGFGEKSMFNIDYHAMSDGELVDRLEKGEMQTNPDFYAEFYETQGRRDSTATQLRMRKDGKGYSFVGTKGTL